LEQPTPDDENERVGPPSEWMEETLINLYLSGYSNREVIAESSLGNTHINEEDRNETTGDKLSNLTSGSASASLNDHHSKLKMKGKLRIPLMWTNLWGKVRNHSFTAFIFSVENNNKAF